MSAGDVKTVDSAASVIDDGTDAVGAVAAAATAAGRMRASASSPPAHLPVDQEGLWDWEPTTGRLHLSARWKQMLGYREDQIGGRQEEWFDRIHRDDRARVVGELGDHVAGKTAEFNTEYRIRQADGSYQWVCVRGSAIYGPDDQVRCMVGSQTLKSSPAAWLRLRDVDSRHDPLTGLASRAFFVERLGQAMRDSGLRDERHWALMSLDVDGFSLLNESLGPLAADHVLRQIAERLTDRFLGTDMVARLDGDEFAVFVDGLPGPEAAATPLLRLYDVFEQPFQVGGSEIYVTASIGVTVGLGEEVRPGEAMRNASIAMQRAKSSGRGRHVMFERGMFMDALTRFDLESALRQALPRGELTLAYQPIVHLGSGTIVGFEALMRWRHSRRGVIAPAQFIPLAESTGIIIEIGAWAVAEACRQLRSWNASRGVDDTPLTVHVNVSKRQLVGDDFVPHVRRALEDARIAAPLLTLEITESTILSDFASVERRMQELKRIGVGLAMDDFGTGYSALSYLHRLPFNTVKVDGSFVRHVVDNQRDSAMVDGIIKLAHNLGLSVTAEGIETEGQLDRLHELGCEEGQGFLFSRAITPVGTEELLRHAPRW